MGIVVRIDSFCGNPRGNDHVGVISRRSVQSEHIEPVIEATHWSDTGCELPWGSFDAPR